MIALLGIDCATQPAKVGLALGELHDGVVHITRCRTGSRGEPPAHIVTEWLRGQAVALIALDAPLGWPSVLGTAVACHKAGQPMGVSSDALFKRVTDVEIRNRFGKRPLEVGANLISRTAVAALELLRDIRKLTNLEIPLAWGPADIRPYAAIEVYPAATRLAHGASDTGGSLAGLDPLIDLSAISADAVRSPDAVDAIVCVLAAADFLQGRAVAPTEKETAVVEGWIWAAAALRG